MKINKIEAYQIFDSRGNPTVETVVTLENGLTGYGLVPSGASTGQYEALELRDGDPGIYRGKSVFKAIHNVNGIIAQALRGQNVYEQKAIDTNLIDLDGSDSKSNLGANAILSVSMAVAKAAAASKGVALHSYLGSGSLIPLPEIQIVGGGAHANWRTDVQDYMIIAVGADSYASALEMTHNVYHAAGDLIKTKGKSFGVADEGGYWPDFDSNVAPIEFLVEAIEAAGYVPGKDVAISLDIAASDLYDGAFYKFSLENKKFTTDEFVELIRKWVLLYPIISIEDPFADNDWEGWSKIHEAIGAKVQLIGDDLFTTNIHRIKDGVEKKIANSVLIKLNQIGTVSETLEAIKLTQDAGWLPVVSARSGETEDAFITHLAVATDAGQLKVGSFARGERMVKWNEGLRILHQMGDKAHFLGGKIYNKILNQDHRN